MKVLLDECVDHSLGLELVGHQATTVGRMGWAGVKNGQLLRTAAAAGFGAFVTTDRSIPFQNTISSIDIAVFILRVRKNRLPDMLPLVPQLLAELSTATPKTVTIIGS